MNAMLMLKRMLNRPTSISGKKTTFSHTSSVLNASNTSENIRIGEHCRIEGELFVFAHAGRISIGDWCFVGPGTRIWSADKLSIGDRVLISHNCNIMDSLTHPLDPFARHAQFKEILTQGHPKSIDLDEKPVRIGDDVWIGAGSTILRGVTIGEKSVVGAGAVVTKDVPPYTLAAGNPARVIRALSPAATPHP